MFSIAIKHLSQPGKFSAELRYSKLAMQYVVYPENGEAAAQYYAVFPGDNYSMLSVLPTWQHHKFKGWYNQQNDPAIVLQPSGQQIASSNAVSCDITNIYAAWQLPATVTFNATDGSSLPSGWTAPDYYVGYSYGSLPTPTLQHKRLKGWYTVQNSPSQSSTAQGTKITTSSIVQQASQQLYTAWQLPATVTFDATTNGGQMPSGWTAPDYYIGQTYGTLPYPTHPTMSFSGWYAGANKVTESSVVQGTSVSLVAQYSTASYSIDLNNGQWIQSEWVDNPDPSAYDGVFESTNQEMDDSWYKMYINVVGYTVFTVYIRSDAESSYDYVIALQPDIDPDYQIDAYSEEAYASTCDNQNSGQSIYDYTPVTYYLDGGSHTICIMYRKDGSVGEGSDQGYVLVPKQQGVLE